MIDDLELAKALLESGVADREQLRQARQLQLMQETTLYLALLENQVIREPALIEVVAGMLNLPFVSLEHRALDTRVARLIPASMARMNGVLPLELRQDGRGEQLLLAMRDPLDIMAMDEVSSHVNVGIQPVLCGPQDLERALERLNRQEAAPPLFESFARDNSVDFGQFSASASSRQEEPEPEPEPEGVDEDSWAVFFDEALSKPVPGDASESISQVMRDRGTMALDLMDIEEILEEEDEGFQPPQDPISMLDEPSRPVDQESRRGVLQGWDVDSSIGDLSASSPPPAPPEPEADDAPSPDSPAQKPPLTRSFEHLYAAIDDELAAADMAPSGTFIAMPSRSLTAEQPSSAEESEPSEVPSLGSAQSESEFLLEDPIEEPQVSDEAGSQTQLGNLHKYLSTPSADESPSSLVSNSAKLSLGQERGGSFTTMGSPHRLNPDGTSRPLLIIQESEGEDLFSQALAHVDGTAEGDPEDDASPVALDAQDDPPAKKEGEVLSLEVSPEAELDFTPSSPSAALGRLKLKRVAVPLQSGPLATPIVERTSSADPPTSEAPAPREEAPRPDARRGLDAISPPVKDILQDDDILAGFQAAFDDEEEEAPAADPAPTAEGSVASAPIEAFFGFGDIADESSGLDEDTNAALGEAHARIERLNKMIRDANQNASPTHEMAWDEQEQARTLGDQGTDGNIDDADEALLDADARERARARKANPFARNAQETTHNTALTRDSLDKMRQSTMDLSSSLLFTGASAPGLPSDIDDSRLLRAALLILISQDLIKIDELVALAKSLPE